MGTKCIFEAGISFLEIIGFGDISVGLFVVFHLVSLHFESIHDVLNDIPLSIKVILGLFRDSHHPFELLLSIGVLLLDV